MSDDNEKIVPVNTAKDKFQLAHAVSRQVQIKNIVIAESATHRSPTFDLDSPGVVVSNKVEFVEFSHKEDDRLLFVRVSFSFSATAPAQESRDELPNINEVVSVKADFVVFYELQSFDGLEQENFLAFAETNGVYNAWPYWREFIQNSTSRMGYTPFLLPVFRF